MAFGLNVDEFMDKVSAKFGIDSVRIIFYVYLICEVMTMIAPFARTRKSGTALKSNDIRWKYSQAKMGHWMECSICSTSAAAHDVAGGCARVLRFDILHFNDKATELDSTGDCIGGQWLEYQPDAILIPKEKPAADLVTGIGISYANVLMLIDKSAACSN
ncbi:putative transglutaminase elicitor [Plasmopara halstedii]